MMKFSEWFLVNENVTVRPYLEALMEDPYDQASWMAMADNLMEDGDAAQKQLAAYVAAALAAHSASDDPDRVYRFPASTERPDLESVAHAFKEQSGISEKYDPRQGDNAMFVWGIYNLVYIARTPRTKVPVFVVINVEAESRTLRRFVMRDTGLKWRNLPERKSKGWQDITVANILEPRHIDGVTFLLAQQALVHGFFSYPRDQKSRSLATNYGERVATQMIYWALNSLTYGSSYDGWVKQMSRNIAEARKAIAQYGDKNPALTHSSIDKMRQEAMKWLGRSASFGSTVCNDHPAMCQAIQDLFNAADQLARE